MSETPLTSDTVRAFLGLGANVGPARRSLERAVAALADLPGAVLNGVSRLYRTRPVGPVAQADFFNAVVVLDVPAGPNIQAAARDLLAQLKRIEHELGRRERERWGPREVDVDLLLFGQHAIRTPREAASRRGRPAPADGPWLEVPHPAARERLFVLAPLAELAPDLRPPGWDRSVRQARDQALAIEGAGAATAIAAWEPALGAWIDIG